MKREVEKELCCEDEIPAFLKADPDTVLATLCKALAHPVRVQIVRILSAKGECMSGDLAEEFDLAASTVSEHLRVLKTVGLIQGSIDGQRRCYCVHPQVLGLLKRLIEDVVGRAHPVRQRSRAQRLKEGPLP